MTTLLSSLALLFLFQAQEPIVFRGTIRLLRSATIETDDVSRLAVVRMHELVSGPSLMRAFVGKDVTVELQAPDRAVANEERIFTARPWLFGESVAVVEVSSRPVPPTPAGRDSARARIRREQAASRDSLLAARLARAQLVVEGRVVAVRPGRRTILSEHDPQWSEADIEVASVLKGQAPRRVTILYPASTDVAWYKVPKPRRGQTGIWVLSSDLPGAPSRDRMGIADRRDVLPRSELERVRRLVRR